MKAIKTIIAFTAATMMFGACLGEKNIDLSPVSYYNEDVVYASDSNLDLFVKSFYNVLYANADIANGYVFDDGVTDLVKYSWWGVNGGTVNQFFYLGDIVNPENNFRSNWGSMYSYIRQINEFFFDVNYGYADNLDADALKVRIAECRFLRAFAYQELILRHGGVILRTREDLVDGPNEKAKARSSEEDSWDFVIKEYDKALADLPKSWSGENAGRATWGAAMGMKARAALYAGRWQDAYDAADSLINSGIYSLVSGSTVASYNTIFTNPFNTEIIVPVYYKESAGNASARQHNGRRNRLQRVSGRSRDPDRRICRFLRHQGRRRLAGFRLGQSGRLWQQAFREPRSPFLCINSVQRRHLERQDSSDL